MSERVSRSWERRDRAGCGSRNLIVARVPNQGEDAPVQVEFEVVVVAGVDGGR